MKSCIRVAQGGLVFDVTILPDDYVCEIVNLFLLLSVLCTIIIIHFSFRRWDFVNCYINVAYR
jgi:hypothetical protein